MREHDLLRDGYNDPLAKNALLEAVRRDNINEVQGILDLQNDIEEDDDYDNLLNCIDSKTGETPLHAAAANQNAPMIELLVGEGADIVAKDNNDRAPIELIPPALRSEFYPSFVLPAYHIGNNISIGIGVLSGQSCTNTSSLATTSIASLDLNSDTASCAISVSSSAAITASSISNSGRISGEKHPDEDKKSR